MRRRRSWQRRRPLTGSRAVLAVGLGIRQTAEAWAEELQLDGATFLSRFDNRAMAAAVMGNPAGFSVSGTCTLLVGDEVVEGALPCTQLKAIVERKLKEIP